jgi:P27 family predicted phage terminase small subunit
VGGQGSGRRPRPPQYFGAVSVEAPEDFDAVALAEWERVTEELGERGQLTAASVSAITVHCRCVSRFEAASLRVAADGLVQTSARSGLARRHPALAIVENCGRDIQRFVSTYGLVYQPAPVPKDDFEDGYDPSNPFAWAGRG